ncbi:MAG: hypothetical protein ACTSU5_19845 [Promethearchaeota archaeon]
MTTASIERGKYGRFRGGVGIEALEAYCARCDLIREAKHLKAELKRSRRRGSITGDFRGRVAALKAESRRLRAAIGPLNALKGALARTLAEWETLRAHRRLLDRGKYDALIGAVYGKFRGLWSSLRAVEELMVDFYIGMALSDEYTPRQRRRYHRNLERLRKEIRRAFPRRRKFRDGSPLSRSPSRPRTSPDPQTPVVIGKHKFEAKTYRAFPVNLKKSESIVIELIKKLLGRDIIVQEHLDKYLKTSSKQELIKNQITNGKCYRRKTESQFLN